MIRQDTGIVSVFNSVQCLINLWKKHDVFDRLYIIEIDQKKIDASEGLNLHTGDFGKYPKRFGKGDSKMWALNKMIRFNKWNLVEYNNK